MLYKSRAILVGSPVVARGTLCAGVTLNTLETLGALCAQPCVFVTFKPGVVTCRAFLDGPHGSGSARFTLGSVEDVIGLGLAVFFNGNPDAVLYGGHSGKDGTVSNLTVDVIDSRLVLSHLSTKLVDVIIVVLARGEGAGCAHYKRGEQKPVDEFFVHT